MSLPEVRMTSPDGTVYRIVPDGASFRIRKLKGYHGEWITTPRGQIRRWRNPDVAKVFVKDLVGVVLMPVTDLQADEKAA